MKKIIGIVIVTVLLCTITCGLCENGDPTEFTAKITPLVVPDNALEIIVSDTQRATLTVCLALDFGISDEGKAYMSNNLISFLTNGSYVASDGTFLVVSGYADGKVLNLFYDPRTGEASYFMTEAGFSDELMEMLVKTTAEKLTFSYKNDLAEVLKVLKIIEGVIND